MGYSCWDIADHGLTLRDWAAFPENGDARLQPNLLPFDNTEFVIGLPTFIGSPDQLRSYAEGGSAPPPPPAEEESMRERGRPPAVYGYPVTGTPCTPPIRPPPTQRKVFVGEAMNEALRGHQ